MQINIPVAAVDTPKAEYVKAAVTVEDRIIVVRNLVGSILELLNLDSDTEVVRVADGANGAIYRGYVDGVAVVVTQVFECQCGGTRVYPK